jgi:hypothetical protein
MGHILAVLRQGEMFLDPSWVGQEIDGKKGYLAVSTGVSTSGGSRSKIGMFIPFYSLTGEGEGVDSRHWRAPFACGNRP